MSWYAETFRYGVQFVVNAVVATILSAGAAFAQDVDRQEGSAWEEIAPFFQPPAELAEGPDRYKSPLVFDDGRTVRTPEHWKERRREILRFWHKSLGPWPPLIEKPRVNASALTALTPA